ncbi:MAG: endolytic transglycosylase MltG [Methylophilaceae bacterium]
MKTVIKRALTFGILVFFCLAFWMAYFAKTPLDLPATSQTITIKANSGLSSIASQLAEQNVIKNKLSFKLLARFLGKESSLQAGEYNVNGRITPYALLLTLGNGGKNAQEKITFIEGKTFKQMRKTLHTNNGIKSTIKSLSDAEVMTLIGADKKHPEGLFFPDTYHFDKGTKDIVLLKRAYQVMQEKLEVAWQRKEAGLPYKSSYEVLIMASIIEKETGKGSERPTIGGVFINRLKIGMRLQTDPTVIYGMGDKFDGNIRRKDLLKDTVYNTYTRYGLPPTPIATPSLASIEGALHPAKTKSLYFVGKGDGTHKFSRTLAEHNRAVRKYQLKR